MKITDLKISGTWLGTTLRYCRLILETETEPGMKSRFHYLCSTPNLKKEAFCVIKFCLERERFRRASTGL